MSETDALSKFDFSKVTGGGLFVKFEAGKPLTLRVLTTDPVVQQQEYEGSDGEVELSTKFCFIVYNFTDDKAQILSASPGIAKKIGELHVDTDFGANIKKLDIKISPTGEKKTRRYDVQVLPKARDLTMEQVKAAQEIDLDEKVKDGQRMSFWTPPEATQVTPDEDIVIEDSGEPINLDDIPF